MKNLLTIFLILFSLLTCAQQNDREVGQLLAQLDRQATAAQIVKRVTERVGIRPSFQLVRNVSSHMHIFLFAFDESEIRADEMLRTLRLTDGIINAQFNHLITSREIPNDPFYANQWHHSDPEDNDVDSDEAWDITTGGTTTTGDEIVICNIEPSGADWNHIDLLDNHWVNENETPDNLVDDDLNGYTDDYDGWSISAEDDNISPGSHGTKTSSMMGARGDNNTGIAGVNWNVKLMQVQMDGVNEANAIEAYTYPLLMRKRYNETNGEAGAFVVVTNSSWGIDGGQPEDSPLWCAMYDSLGVYGILNCGSTANDNVNIDVVGDLPTGCTSDYLISVTATDNNDVRDFSGYGIVSIDLGAPGDQVYLANNNNNYGSFNGTSFASPCVAGAVALLYSAPCNSLMPLVNSSPAEAALLVKNYILDGVDAVSNLSDEVASGGRLNVNNALLLLLEDCNSSGCISPFLIEVDWQEGTSNYMITWGITEEMNSYVLRYRVVGEVDWIDEVEEINNFFLLQNLNACTEYEMQLMAFCNNGESSWSDSVSWTTDGCCENPALPSILLDNLQPTSVQLSWENITAATAYTITLTDELGEEVVVEVTENNFLLTGLLPCTSYQLQLYTECEEGEAPTAEVVYFNTPGCENCADMIYCDVDANAQSEWIEQVLFGDINNATASDGGYGDYTAQSTTIDIGATYSISLTPGFSITQFTEYFKVWIDYNINGEFEDVELAFDAGTATSTAISGQILVPWNALSGSTRMRVAMSWVGALGAGGEPEECGNNLYGEAEDYCVSVNTDVAVVNSEATAFQIFPNPTRDVLTIKSSGTKGFDYFMMNAMGALVISNHATSDVCILSVDALAAGIYTLLISGNGKMIRQKVVVE